MYPNRDNTEAWSQQQASPSAGVPPPVPTNSYVYNPYADSTHLAPVASITEVDAAIRANAQAPVPPGRHRNAPASRSGSAKASSLVLTLFLGLMFIGGAGSVYFFIIAPTMSTADQQSLKEISSDDAEALFTAMLSQAMDVTTFERKLAVETQVGADNAKLTRKLLIIQSDFSDIKRPKSTVALDVNQQTGSSQTRHIADYIADSDDTFIKLRSVASQPANSSLDTLFSRYKNTWLRLGVSERSDAFLDTALLTTAPQLADLNRPAFMGFIVGNIDDALQEEALSFAFLQQLYTIQSFKQDSIDGDRVIQYTVSIKNNKLAEYAATAGIDYSQATSAEVSTAITVYVDTAGMLRRVEVTGEAAKITADYTTYGKQFTIETPASATPLP